MFTIALRDMREHWARFLMSIVTVVLATAFVAATFSFTAMLGDSISQLSDSANTSDIYVRGAESEDAANSFGPPQREPVPVEIADEAEDVEGVRVATPVLFGMAILVGEDGKAVANGHALTFATVLVEGVDEFEIVLGREPEGLEEIALAAETLELSGYRLGDSASVTVGDGHTFTAEIVGAFEPEFSMMGASFVFLSQGAGLDLLAPAGTVRTVAIVVDDGADIEEVTERLAAALGSDVDVVTGEQMREESKSATAEAMGFIEIFMLIFAFIALFVGSFLISNTFAMIVRQRQREFALLRALGASPGQVIRTLLAQAVIIGFVGALLGIGLGILLVMGAQQIFASMNVPFEGSPVLAPIRMVLIVIAAVAFTCVASIIPARRAAATAPVEAMRPEDPKPERTARVRGVLAGLMVIGGAVALVYAVREVEAIWLGVGAFLLLVGMLGLGPLIVPPLLGLVGLPFKLLRPVGALARGNVLRNPKRTSATAAALTIGMTFVSAAAVLAASATASTRSIIDNQMDADFYVGSQMAMVPTALLEVVDSLPAVKDATPGYIGFVQTVDPASSLTVAGMSEEGYANLLHVPIIEGDEPTGPNDVVVSKALWEDDGISPGDTLTFSVPGSDDVTMNVTGVTNDSFISANLYTLTAGYEQLVPEDSRALVFILVNSAGSLEDTRDQLEMVLAEVPVLSVMDQEELADQTVGMISSMMNVLYALLGLSLVIAVLSIVNTLALAVTERTREIGLMRAVGLGERQLTAMIMIESVLTAVFGAVMGMAIGVLLGALLPPVLSDLGLTELVIPWVPLLTMLGVTVAVSVIAAIWPAIRAIKLPVLDAVSSE